MLSFTLPQTKQKSSILKRFEKGSVEMNGNIDIYCHKNALKLWQFQEFIENAAT